MKPQDTKAATIKFGVEIETYIPINSGIAVGAYHQGNPVSNARSARSGRRIEAPTFNGAPWRAERDGSIRPDDTTTQMPCEFTSPILEGEAGVQRVRDFVQFLNRIGAKTNDSCGLHVTVSIESVIGSTEAQAVSAFCQKLATVANHNTWAIFAQTKPQRASGNTYCARLQPQVETLLENALKATDPVQKQTLTTQCGRGMVNFCKAFTNRAIEFRAWAGTIEEPKVLHHVATALGIMRRAHETQTFGSFAKSSKKCKAATAPDALRRMWRVLGWCDSVPGRECALGLFGPLHSEFPAMKAAALESADAFEQAMPAANL